jgi:hypothetical protein
MPSVPLVRSRRAGLKPGWSCCRPCPILSNTCTVRDRICKKLLGIARAIHTVKPLVVHPSRALGPTKHPSSFLRVGWPAGISSKWFFFLIKKNSAWFSIPLARSFLVDRRSVPCADRPAYRTVTWTISKANSSFQVRQACNDGAPRIRTTNANRTAMSSLAAPEINWSPLPCPSADRDQNHNQIPGVDPSAVRTSQASRVQTQREARRSCSFDRSI